MKMELYDDHEVGNPECPRCYLKKTKRNCGECGTGLMHEEYSDENWDGDVSTITQCDKCGSYWG